MKRRDLIVQAVTGAATLAASAVFAQAPDRREPGRTAPPATPAPPARGVVSPAQRLEESTDALVRALAAPPRGREGYGRGQSAEAFMAASALNGQARGLRLLMERSNDEQRLRNAVRLFQQHLTNVENELGQAGGEVRGRWQSVRTAAADFQRDLHNRRGYEGRDRNGDRDNRDRRDDRTREDDRRNNDRRDNDRRDNDRRDDRGNR